jgi:hypothetical protein
MMRSWFSFRTRAKWLVLLGLGPALIGILLVVIIPAVMRWIS